MNWKRTRLTKMIDKDEIFSGTKPEIDTYMKYKDNTLSNMMRTPQYYAMNLLNRSNETWKQSREAIDECMVERRFKQNRYIVFTDSGVRQYIKEIISANTV